MTELTAASVRFERAGRTHLLDKNGVYDHLHWTCPNCGIETSTIYSSALDRGNGVKEHITCKCGTAFVGIYKPENNREIKEETTT